MVFSRMPNIDRTAVVPRIDERERDLNETNEFLRYLSRFRAFEKKNAGSRRLEKSLIRMM